MTKLSAQNLNTNQKGFTPIIIALVVVLLIGGGYLAYRSFKGSPQPALVTQPSSTQQPTSSAKPTSTNSALRSKAPGIVTQVAFSRTIDPKTGIALNPATTFSKTDPAIYVVVSLNNPPVGAKIEYVRYLNGKFLDNRSTATTKTTDKSVVFGWYRECNPSC